MTSERALCASGAVDGQAHEGHAAAVGRVADRTQRRRVRRAAPRGAGRVGGGGSARVELPLSDGGRRAERTGRGCRLWASGAVDGQALATGTRRRSGRVADRSESRLVRITGCFRHETAWSSCALLTPL